MTSCKCTHKPTKDYTTLPIAKAKDLAKMSDYQEGSIISQEIIRNSAGTITLFAFAKGQGLSEHTTPFQAALQVIEGEAKVTIDGKETTVKSGQIIILPAKVPHSVSAREKFKMLLTMLRGD